MRDLEINGLTGEEETRRQYEYIEKARQYVAQKEKEAGRKLTCCVHTFGLDLLMILHTFLYIFLHCILEQ